MQYVKKLSAVIFAIIVSLILFIQFTGNKTFDISPPDIVASPDPSIVAHGKYLVFGPAHCAPCHVPPDKMLAVDNGLETPLIGGMTLNIPPARLNSPNLTPDIETGIGSLTDGALARSIRQEVKHDGQYLLPVMSYAGMSDEDLQAIISYLRSQESVYHEVPPSSFTFIGKALLAFGIMKPKQLKQPPPQRVEKSVSIEYGSYLAKGVANCMGCHTELDVLTGDFINAPYAGGFYFEPDEFTQGKGFVSPNITPHPTTGVMTNWTQDKFISRFKLGRTLEGSPMPWGSFSRMDSTDLIALYQFLQSQEPVHNEVGQTVFEPDVKPE